MAAMRVAVLSDIHGFSIALETVLADIDRTGPYDEIVVAGDLCEVGPAPAEVLEILQSGSYFVIQGNTDFDIVDAAHLGNGRGSLDFVIDQIKTEGVDYLDQLPFSRRITPPGADRPEHDLLVVHANPHNLLDRMGPDMSDLELQEVIGDERAGAIAFGHYHVCFIRRLDDQLLVDVSATGNPKDGDLRCKYGVLTWVELTKRWNAELRKLDYPLAETEDQILNSALPNPEKVLKKLVKARY
jgi:predicted phosphodiesterase